MIYSDLAMLSKVPCKSCFQFFSYDFLKLIKKCSFFNKPQVKGSLFGTVKRVKHILKLLDLELESYYLCSVRKSARSLFVDYIHKLKKIAKNMKKINKIRNFSSVINRTVFLGMFLKAI